MSRPSRAFSLDVATYLSTVGAQLPWAMHLPSLTKHSSISAKDLPTFGQIEAVVGRFQELMEAAAQGYDYLGPTQRTPDKSDSATVPVYC